MSTFFRVISSVLLLLLSLLSESHGFIAGTSCNTHACGFPLQAKFNEQLTTELPRDQFLHSCISIIAGSAALVCKSDKTLGFDGGVGGLGKTKPSTGVEFYDEDFVATQTAKGIVSSELVSQKGNPLLVKFQSPLPLLSTAAGLETRDLRQSESAFVQVVPSEANWKDPKKFRSILIESVLASQGKFGAYGTPTDIKVKKASPSSSPSDSSSSSSTTASFGVTFVSYTPAMRESERQLLIKAIEADNTLVMMVAGTTRPRYSSQEGMLQKIVDSFEVAVAPKTRARKELPKLSLESSNDDDDV